MNKPRVTGGVVRRQAEVRNWLAGRRLEKQTKSKVLVSSEIFPPLCSGLAILCVFRERYVCHIERIFFSYKGK